MMIKRTNTWIMRLVIVCALFLCLFISPISAAADEIYQFERMWPSLLQPWYFSMPQGIAIDSNSTIYVADTENNRIQKFTVDGFLITTWGTSGSDSGQFNRPTGIAVDSYNHIYVADTGNNRIQKFTSNGQFLREWKTYGSGETLSEPIGIASDTVGNVYVTATRYGYDCFIVKFTSDGGFISSWGQKGVAEGQFHFINDYFHGLAVDNHNNVYVVDNGNTRIQKFDSNGNYLTHWRTAGDETPSGITIDNSSNIYVSDIADHIQKFDSNGNYLTKWGGSGFEDERLENPYGIAADTNNNIYVVDSFNQRIQKFTGNGQFLTKWCAYGTSQSQFITPTGIAIDNSTRNIYVVDSGNQRIQKFTGDGQYLIQWGGQGSTIGQFNIPSRIAVDAFGNVYVTDTFNHRIQKFDADGHNPVQICDGQFQYPVGTALDTDRNIYIADRGNNRIQKFNSSGNYLTQWSNWTWNNLVERFNNPSGIAIDNFNNVYVADRGNNRIVKFDSNGHHITQWGEGGVGNGNFDLPYGVAVDAENNVYVADNSNNRIQKFDSNGNFIATWGNKGSSPGQLYMPYDLAVTKSTGNRKIYVTDTYNHRIQVFKKVTEGFNSRAIIVAGGGPGDGNNLNNLWDATQVAANFAYRALTYRGFSKNDIYYLSANTKLDLDNNGLPDDVRAAPSRYTLWQAITQWAVNEKADTLVLYMADHGGSGTFRLSGSEVLTVDELAEWLNQLSCKVIVVYDACESGSFLSKLQGSNRIIIASTLPDEQAKFLGQGTLSFSSFFWTHILNGLSIEEAFSSSSIEINFAFANQSPQMAGDAQNVYIGNRGSNTAADAPQIGDVSPPQVLSDGTTAVLSADSVTDPDGIARVWAVIWPPDYTISPDQPVTDLNLASIDLKPVICDPTATGCLYNPQTGEGGYEVSYNQFVKEGTYYIALYAMDRKGNTSLPKLTTVSRNFHLTRRAIIVAGETSPDLSRDTINYSAALAYNALTAQLYGYEDIYLMSPTSVPDIFCDNRQTPPTPVQPSLLYFEDYLKNLATTAGQLDLVVYLVGAGTPAAFQMMGTTELTATEFDRMLDTLQTQKPGSRVTVIYDGDYAGSFTPLLIPPTLIPPTGEKRIVITSTCATAPAYFRGQGKASFSSFFWQQVASGAILYDAFAYARSALQYLSWRQEISFSCYGLQNPLLDADGDGVANEEDDFRLARKVSIGMGIRFADDPPVIGSVSAIEDSTTGIVTIVAEDITATKQLKRVWAVIKRIGYCPGGSGEQPAALIEKDLTDADDNGTYTVSFNPQDYGIMAFRVSVYATDEDNNTSAPQETGVQQSAGQQDIYEPDDTPQEANPIVVNYGSIGPDGKPIGEAQPHNFHTAADMDWVMFHAVSEKAYVIEAGSLEQNCSPVIELYKETDLIHPVAGTDIVTTVNGKEVVALDWECPAGGEGNYYVRLWNKLAYGGGDQTGYKLKVYDGGAITHTMVTGYIRNKRTGAPIVTGQAFATPLIEWHDLENTGVYIPLNARPDGSYASSFAPSNYKCTIKAAGYKETDENVNVPEYHEGTMAPALLHDFYLEPYSTTTSSSTSTTTVPCLDMSITSVTPEQIRIGFGLLPRIKRMTVTASVDITGRNLNFAGQRGIMVLGLQKVQSNTITANVLFWGVKPGDCIVQIDQCAAKTIQILRGF